FQALSAVRLIFKQCQVSMINTDDAHTGNFCCECSKCRRKYTILRHDQMIPLRMSQQGKQFTASSNGIEPDRRKLPGSHVFRPKGMDHQSFPMRLDSLRQVLDIPSLRHHLSHIRQHRSRSSHHRKAIDRNTYAKRSLLRRFGEEARSSPCANSTTGARKLSFHKRAEMRAKALVIFLPTGGESKTMRTA